ncbi:MAG: hypothetical protein ACRDBO_12280 [Lachnospiraceae bacterium]
MAYAEKTSVSVSKSKADIEELIQKYGADQFVSGYKDNIAVIGFTMAGRQIKFILPLPDKQAREYWIHQAAGRSEQRMPPVLPGNKRAGVAGEHCIL